MKNYEFELNHDTQMMALHMMDRAEKYLNRICDPNSQNTPQIHIHGPENLPSEILNMIEGSIQNKFSDSFTPKEGLQGVISIKLHNPYTIIFELGKLWFEQKHDEVQDQIIAMMGLESDYLELDWAEKQWDELKASDEEEDLNEND